MKCRIRHSTWQYMIISMRETPSIQTRNDKE